MPTSAAAGSSGAASGGEAAQTSGWEGPSALPADRDSIFEGSAFDAGAAAADAGRLKRRRSALVLLALLGCLGVFALAYGLAATR